MRSVASTFLATTALLILLLAGTPAAAAQEVPNPTVPAPEADTPAPTVTSPAPLVEVPAPQEVPEVTISVDSENGALSQTVTIILLLTVAAVAPGILLLTTAFTRFAIVLGLTRNAIGVQTIPPSQVLIGLSLVLTVFVMGPIFGKINDEALQPMLNGDIEQGDAIEAGYEPLREFMLAQTREEDLRLFMNLSSQEKPETADEVSATTLIPAFVISELRTAFIIGFIIFVPFLVIDLIVSAVLMSMGMVMLPPVFISLPLKLLIFVLVDGWALIIGSVVQSVNGVVG